MLEQMFKLKWIERKEHSFFLGIIYTIIGIISAYILIPSYAGIMSIAFTSILLIPSLNKLLQEEENIEIREKKLSLKLLFRDHKDIIKVYLFLFLGIFATYFIIASIFNATILFNEQLTMTGVIGNATKIGFFKRIVLNNLIVFIACFILSLFYGAGSILFLTINSSVWGATFGFLFKKAIGQNGNVITIFITYILPILPHTIIEALSYINAAIVGGIVSKAVLREKVSSKKFKHIITDALIFLGFGLTLVIVAGLLEQIAKLIL